MKSNESCTEWDRFLREHSCIDPSVPVAPVAPCLFRAFLKCDKNVSGLVVEPNDLLWSLTEFMWNMSPITTYKWCPLKRSFNMSQDRTNHLQEKIIDMNILVHQIKPDQDLCTKCGIARKKTPPESSTFPIFIFHYQPASLITRKLTHKRVRTCQRNASKLWMNVKGNNPIMMLR